MIGQHIHGYQINAHLGQGGMGNVFRATDKMLGREVALKMLHPQLTMQAQFLERFKKEARVLAQLLHPNIAVIYNFIEQDGHHFMVMEYVEGTSLDDLLKKYKTLPASFVVPVFIQALEGLQHAHKKNILHRDIKPSNLMLTTDGTLKIMDFGIAKVAGEQKMTQVNKIVGTVEFMAPELIQGKEASAASDIYAMGVTLYELVSGQLPFESDTDFNLMQAILKKKIKPLEKLGATIPKALSDIVMKALDKNPDNRYPDARSFQQALINAFPNYRDIDVNTLQVVSFQSTAQGSRAITQPNNELLTAVAGMETRFESPVAGSGATFFQRVKQKLEDNRKIALLICALLLGLVIFSVILTKTNSSDQNKLAQNDTPKQKLPEVPVNDQSFNITPPVNNTTPVENKGPIVVTPTPPVKNQPEKPVEKKPEVKKPEEKQKEVKEEKLPEPKPVEKKDIYINSKVEVELYLRENLDNADEHKDLPVNFSVSSNVYYNGTLIIKQGAIASGVIKVGKIQTDIDINSVQAVNGQQVRLKATRGHGRRKEIATNRNYTAIIQTGAHLNL